MRTASVSRGLEACGSTPDTNCGGAACLVVFRVTVSLMYACRRLLAVSVIVLAVMWFDLTPGKPPRQPTLGTGHFAMGAGGGQAFREVVRGSSLSTATTGSSPSPTTTVTAPQTQVASTVEFEDSGLRFDETGALAWGDYDNDGDLDLVLAGRTADGPRTSIYRNDGGTFTRMEVPLVPVVSGDVAWADFDRDGDLDLALAGQGSSGPVCRIYQNNGGVFTDLQAGLGGAGFSALAWGDADNNAHLDLAVAGSNRARLYTNDDGVFSTAQIGVGGAQLGSTTWSDWDGDGHLDLTVTGEYNTGWSIVPVTRVFRNTGEGGFVEVDLGLPLLSNSSVAWGDYDNDGDVDLAICGFDIDGTAVSRIYRNDGNDTFTDIGVDLTGLGAGDLAWGDVDNDGDLDLVAAGFYYNEVQGQQCRTRLYRNDGNDAFTAVSVPFIGVHYASLAWGDYDGDGDLDLAISGVTCDYQPITRIYRNNCPTPDTPPSPPTNLTAEGAADGFTFRWDAGSDAETPAAGLYYHLRVGSRPGADDIYSAMADLTTGQRRLPGFTGVRQQLSRTIQGLSDPPYYWSVQSVDTAFAGSMWAGEQVATRARVHNTTQDTVHETIQEAIDQAQFDDEIVVAPGLYSGTGNWDIDLDSGLSPGQHRRITLRSTNPLNPDVVARTVIDCTAIPSRWPHRAFRLALGSSSQAVITGLTIRNAEAPRFEDVSMDGGAIYCGGIGPTISHCVFDSCGSPGRGGAIAVAGSALIQNCVFTGNRADIGGGAIYSAQGYLQVNNCRFQGNSGGAGGALLHEGSIYTQVFVRNSLFDANYAVVRGGAMFLNASVSLEMTNCTLINNGADEGGGLYAAAGSYPLVWNSILWGNADSEGTGEISQARIMQWGSFGYCHIQGWDGLPAGGPNSAEDPLLAGINGPDGDPGTWQDNSAKLTRFSPCINGADPNMSYAGQQDLDGNERHQSCRADVGAYETPWSLPRADYNGDCHVDGADLEHLILCGTGADVPLKNPDCAEADLDFDGDVDSDDFAIFQRCWSGPDLPADPGCAT